MKKADSKKIRWYKVGGWWWGVTHTTDNTPPHGNVYCAVLASTKRGQRVTVYTRGDGKKMADGYFNVHVAGVMGRNERESMHEWVRMAATGAADCPPPPPLETTERVAKALGAEPVSGGKKPAAKKPADNNRYLYLDWVAYTQGCRTMMSRDRYYVFTSTGREWRVADIIYMAGGKGLRHYERFCIVPVSHLAHYFDSASLEQDSKEAAHKKVEQAVAAMAKAERYAYQTSPHRTGPVPSTL